ncbi:hypothetical protein [Methanobrevibacter filiformis]|uniref:Uncharacterized protein n=1 Tax=Methanobrevibacter filiformis TaxID=55758 RepID=A0A162FG55_9EURY|nr:hypothetical protein [Methanobrevibacter filiformis]KZX12575.1 hypothetical protein MBFIL_11150 [Methanobrevibacter filiformis]
MGRNFDILMAGIISGIVAITTTYLGLGGTVIGAVLGSMIYQICAQYLKEPLEKSYWRKIENNLVYIIPLILIIVIEIIFAISILKPDTTQFVYLEEITNWTLFRAMGIGLCIMGIYPIIQPRKINKKYGVIIFSLGIILVLRGMIDSGWSIVELYSQLFVEFDFIIAIIIIIVLMYISLDLFRNSINGHDVGIENKKSMSSINNNKEKYGSKSNNMSKNSLVIRQTIGYDENNKKNDNNLKDKE